MPTQSFEPCAKVSSKVVAFAGVVMIVADDGICVPAGVVADAAEPAAACLDKGRQHRLDPVAERQVGEADDAGCNAGLAAIARVAFRRQPRYVFDLADRTHLDWTILAIGLAALDEYGGFDVVAARSIGLHFLDQIATWCAPQVMVRVDDRKFGLEDRLGWGARQPLCAWREDAAECRRLRIGTHIGVAPAMPWARAAPISL